ncbi:MAG TPA: 5-oxoprolinase subunit PxpA [Thermoanaerobaculaceae bacterium]|nr:5-oxoprolinase subunit PxpA [Acidobacteriota bacterium]NLH12184.1 LamB/YcsF family protein [Holophagae bacterium]HPW55002.1 5-oxoprolinase subunit PxpA [Thermoanaerobaculaceae bacterium]
MVGGSEPSAPPRREGEPPTNNHQPSTVFIDLNLDAGERPEAIADGSECELMALVCSVNIACGAHAGDVATMAATLAGAHSLGVVCGAHPGYPDRAGFGRASLELAPEEIAATVRSQVATLARLAAECGVHLAHVKPHGALYADAARDPAVAAAVAAGAAPWREELRLVGLAGSPCLEVYRRAGFDVVAEAFAERRYEPDGTLRPRRFPDAVICAPDEAAAQAVRIAGRREVVAADGTVVGIRADTLCIHSDSPGALAVARAVRRALDGAGIAVRAVGHA